MTRVIGSRLLSTALVLFGVSLVVFLLLQLVPGDPAVTILGSGATAGAVAELRSELGLDRALPIQFFDYLGGLLQGDLGRSLTVNAPVTDIMVPRFVNTMILTGAALLLCIVIAVPLGVIAAHKQYSLFDRMSMVISMAGASVPVYWFGLLLIGVFAITLGWLPTSGMYDPRFPGGFGDLLAHLVLPAIAAALVPLAVIARMTRSVMIDILAQDYIRTLRASGLSTSSVLWRHALRNALPRSSTSPACRWATSSVAWSSSRWCSGGQGSASSSTRRSRNVTSPSSRPASCSSRWRS